MKKLIIFLRRGLPVALTVVILGWGIWYIIRQPDQLAAIGRLSRGWIAVLFSLSIVKLAAMGALTKFALSSLGIELSLMEWFGLSAVSAMGNYLTPFRGGAAVRAVYLKSRHHLSYPLFISTLLTVNILAFSASAALGFLAALGMYVWYGFLDTVMMAVFILLLCLPGVVFSLARAMPRFSPRLSECRGTASWRGAFFSRVGSWVVEILSRIVEGWQIVSAHSATLLMLIAVSIANACVTLLMIHFSFTAFGARLPLLESLMLGSLYMTSGMIPITPSGLGVAEVVMVLASRGSASDAPSIVLAAGLTRVVMLTSSVLFGTVFGYVLGTRTVPTGDLGE